jgi:pimeloyl-ACP methyl ester carboxylesterase
MSAGVATVDGAELAYRIDGEGPDLVLVHAGVADLRMWDPLVALVADRFRIVRYDMRGFGASTSEPGAFLPSGDLSGLMQELGVEHPVLVGASFGGLVALELAAMQPSRVARLVLLDALLPGHEWSQRFRAFGAAENAALEAGDVDEAVRLNVELWAGEAEPEVQALVSDMQGKAFRIQMAVETEEIDLDPPVSERLAAVDMPVTVAYGERDVEDFVAMAEQLAAELPAATLHRIAGAGHLPALERPDAVAELILGA